MTTINSNEFITNQEKYFDLAISEDVCIKNGEDMFQLKYYPVCEPKERAQILKEPDDDLRRAITIDEFVIGVKEDLVEIFRNGQK